MSDIIDIDGYIAEDPETEDSRTWDEVKERLGRAMLGEVSYVRLGGRLVACIAPPEAGERYEHANEVVIQPRQRETAPPVPVRTRRPRFWRYR